MNHVDVALFVAVMLPVAGFTIWAWFAMAKVEEEMRSFVGFEGLHLEPDAVAATDFGGAVSSPWPKEPIPSPRASVDLLRRGGQDT